MGEGNKEMKIGVTGSKLERERKETKREMKAEVIGVNTEGKEREKQRNEDRSHRKLIRKRTEEK